MKAKTRNGSVKSRMLESLKLKREWMTANEIAQHLGESPDAVKGVISSMKARNEIRFRPTERGNYKCEEFTFNEGVKPSQLLAMRWA